MESQWGGNSPSLIHTIILAALPTAEYDTAARNLAAVVNPTRADRVRMLGERFHTLERSQGKISKTYGYSAIYTGAPAVNKGGRRGYPRSGGKSVEGQANSNDAKPGYRQSRWRQLHALERWCHALKCGKKGHIVRDCRVMICERCGGGGHDVEACPTAKQSEAFAGH